MLMKNSSDTIGNWTRDLLTCSSVPQPTALLYALYHWYKGYWNSRGKYGMHTHGCTEMCKLDLKFLQYCVSFTKVFLELLIQMLNNSDCLSVVILKQSVMPVLLSALQVELLWQIVFIRLQHSLFYVSFFGELLNFIIQILCVQHYTIFVFEH